MAVTLTKSASSLVIKLKTGVLNGQDVFQNVTFRRIKTSALDQDIYDVAMAIAGLLANPVSSVSKQETSELINA